MLGLPSLKGHTDILKEDFYSRDTALVAREMLGKILVHESSQGTAAGIVVETEAYLQSEAACHAARGMTPRNRVMFGRAGIAYVYFTYGMHHCFNVVTEEPGVACAVLVRALEPLEGIELMRARRGRDEVRQLCGGPARLVQAMGITGEMNGINITRGPLYLARGKGILENEITVTTRVGISQAADLLLRFYITGSRFVSKK